MLSVRPKQNGKMKIAYIDLNYPDHYESYSINPKKYGGGRIFAAYAKELISNFHIFADPRSFEDVDPKVENSENCHPITSEVAMAIRNGGDIEALIPELAGYDMFVHHFTNIHLNTKKPQICWSLGYEEVLHPDNKHVMLYGRKHQNLRMTGNNHVIHDVIIGSFFTMPEFKEDKEDYIFQCTRHTNCFGSVDVAKICMKNNIRCYFAGPIDKGYPLMDYIDNKNTFYFGVISESKKSLYTSRARLYTFIHSWPTPFNLSAIEALKYGTPIVATPVGFWPDLIQEGKNGFIIRNEEEFLEAWKKSANINQDDCIETAKKYSVANMITTFKEAITKAANDSCFR